MDDANAVIQTLALTLIGMGALLCFLPVGTCSECPHCARARADAVRKRAEAAHNAFHRPGIDADPHCSLCRQGGPKEKP